MYCSDQDRRLFLELLEEMSVRFNIKVYAYVLMSNHYYLQVKTFDWHLVDVCRLIVDRLKADGELRQAYDDLKSRFDTIPCLN